MPVPARSPSVKSEPKSESSLVSVTGTVTLRSRSAVSRGRRGQSSQERREKREKKEKKKEQKREKKRQRLPSSPEPIRRPRSPKSDDDDDEEDDLPWQRRMHRRQHGSEEIAVDYF